jgi:His/Glu/Gln/Arg/opine family amino acid ABC transporter permease subunit
MTELWGVLTRHFPELASGFLITVRLVAISFVIAIVIGVTVAAFRIAPTKPLRWLGTVYVEIFRNIPLLVLITIFFFGFSDSIQIGPWVAGTVALGLYTAAYVAEAIRSGVSAVGRGQIDAALAMGLTYRATLTKIILPQAVRTVIPPLGNLMIAMTKNSAIIGASALGIRDLLKEARIIQARTFAAEAFFWSAVGYLIITVGATVLVRYLEKRLVIRR